MKKQRFTALLLAGILSLSFAGIVPAATGTKTATLNNAKVRFNGGAVQTVQCYNIDGSNYVRARDITNNVDMDIAPLADGGNKGVMVISQRNEYETYGKRVTPARLTKPQATVQVINGKIDYDGSRSNAPCFLLDGSYYFKATAFESAAEANLAAVRKNVAAEAGQSRFRKPSLETHYGITVEWNGAERIIEIDRTETDLLAEFNRIRGIETEKEPVKEPVKEGGEGVLQAAPKVGSFPANILIDKKAGAYRANGSVNIGNYHKPYTLFPETHVGECTWYAYGRFVEVYGEELAERNPFHYGARVTDWLKNVEKGDCPDLKTSRNRNDVEAGCVAVWNGHTAFVEWVEYDSKGLPKNVYITEANAYHSGDMEIGRYYPDFDGKVQKLSLNDFIGDRTMGFAGYVMVK